MDLDKAKKIIADNFFGNEGSLTCSLYDECKFSDEKFWDFYDSIAFLVTNSVKSEELTGQICISYQRILKEMIYHFSPYDLAVMDNFPENYNDYIERLDLAVRAYFSGETGLLNDDIFELQR